MRVPRKYEGRYPHCSVCGDPIFEDVYYEVDNDIYCEECLRMEYAKDTDEYVRENEDGSEEEYDCY